MQLPFFYEPTIQSGDKIIPLSEETSKHCIQVLRMKVGDLLLLTDGKGLLATAAISEANKKHAFATVQSIELKAPQSAQCTVGMALLKNSNRYEWFLEKATELGVSKIIPLITEHTEKDKFRWDRMNGILIAAMLQSQQYYLPILESPQSFEAVLETEKHVQQLLAHCEDRPKTALTDIKMAEDTIILIGPEGDFSTPEIDLALSKSYVAVSLGKTRLRTETAGVVAATIVKLNQN